MVGAIGCRHSQPSDPATVIRFDRMVFTIPPAGLADSIRQRHPEILPFFRIFNEEAIGIGPDTLPGYAGQLEGFTNDSMIRELYASVEKSAGYVLQQCEVIDQALDRYAGLTGGTTPERIVTYLSGFNQSFITLPGILGIGLDNFLGSESPFYQQLGIPVYIRKGMNPDNLAPDAVRAWLYSELPPPSVEGGFLDRMIFEGKVYYIMCNLLPGVEAETIFHYTADQWQWCEEQEEAMWKFLAEQKILFSTDRMTIRRYMEEAPFTRDFGNESPGRVGTWIGWRIVSGYMKATGASMAELVANTNPREILSGSKYHP